MHAVFNLPVEWVAHREKERNAFYVLRNNTFRPRGWIGETDRRSRVFAGEIAKRKETSFNKQIEVKCTTSCAPK